MMYVCRVCYHTIEQVGERLLHGLDQIRRDAIAIERLPGVVVALMRDLHGERQSTPKHGDQCFFICSIRSVLFAHASSISTFGQIFTELG